MASGSKPLGFDVTPRPKSAENPPAYDEDDNILVIGIDFGTTYSGVAWATQTDFNSDQINLITSWPGSGREEGKAPTEICYENGMQWGFEVEKDANPITWFKLLLLKQEDLSPELCSSEFLLRSQKMAQKNNKTPIDLIADYLRAIWNHTLEVIVKDRGDSVLEAYQLHVVITVPAIWKDYARQNMENAAKKAGILDRRAAGKTVLTFVPEPEAAALSTLCDPGRQPKKDDVYLICDAGGGTVDLITYKITGVDPILMNEAVEGTGGLCGGIFIDEAFEAMIKNRLGRKWNQISQSGIKEMLKGDWELSIKPQYKPGNGKKEYIVSIPAEAYQKDDELFNDMTQEPFIKRGRIHFKGSHIEKAFAEPFAKIDELIEAQILKAKKQGLSLTGIILVGGLGVHLQQDKIWDKEAHEWKATNQMRWYLKKGENVSTKAPVSHEWHRLYQTNDDFDGTFVVTIRQCQEGTPPARNNNSVKEWAKIKCSIDVPFWGLKDHWNKAGVRVKRLDYHVEMVPSGASIEFTVVVDGKKVGKSQFQTHFS
ncbi:hypothetical protein CDV36_007943 [Fusarium kuroshium]|uniref:Uncharacterized protein n=2 Tax=Fusarium solani species complex TaxID=232080 RepID=A0A3M2S4C8_9HYPO|nr:hypothetical protein CDV36_007943 [Fusarium kuroshium]RSL82004.1 hypothetical protein CEP51_005453 [Fusarium floridanum]